MIQWKKYRRQMKNENKSELPWLMMLSAADYRKKKFDEEIFSELEELAMRQEQVREALIEWESLSANKENRALYEARAKELRDLLSNLDGERRLGMKEGLEEGIKKGLEKGNAMISREIAMNMINKGFADDIISEITKLNAEEIMRLRRGHGESLTSQNKE